MAQRTFLVEIGTEELPPKSLRHLASSFANNFVKELGDARLIYSQIEWFATPRRLALKVADLCDSQSNIPIEKRGPAVAQAFNANGEPTKAAEGWANACGIEISQAKRLITSKGEWLVYRTMEKGLTVQALLLGLVNNALVHLPIPKPMRWSDKEIQFIRPVHTVALLYGDELIKGSVLGIESAKIIRGHRFMGESEFMIDSADQYPHILWERGKVMADYIARKELIQQDIERAAEKMGGHANIDESLLEEVTSLVEYPVVLTAKFEEKFLDIPSEALVHTMKNDQKYFPIYNGHGKLLPHFIFVSNIKSKEPKQIISGNEKVIRPRFSDAEFFFHTDLKERLEDRLPRLEGVVFQQQLGTLRNKADRMETLAGWVASKIGTDVSMAMRAGLLSKCDLMTNMVFEFTDTQGVMGMYYARHDGETEEVAVALNEQYMPRFSGDKLPNSLVACAVAIADKIDTLVGIFGISLYPKGDKDPFALRRAALGILRIIVEKKLHLDLAELSEKAVSLYGNKLTNKNINYDVIEFMLGRFRSWYQDEGYSNDVISAVLARRPTKPVDFDIRVKAVSHFCRLEDAESLAAANKRVSNILSRVDYLLAERVDSTLLMESAEIKLATHLVILSDKLGPMFAEGRYQEALVELTALRKPIDAFFDQVMVMAEEPELRINRLTLLSKLQYLFLQVADISLLK